MLLARRLFSLAVAQCSMGDENKLTRAMEAFELLLAAASALVRAKSARPALLSAYDDASERLMDGLRGNGIPEEALQSIHKALARLRLAFEENPPK